MSATLITTTSWCPASREKYTAWAAVQPPPPPLLLPRRRRRWCCWEISVCVPRPLIPLRSPHCASLTCCITLRALPSPLDRRKSINVLKDMFRDELSKDDWRLVVKLKKVRGSCQLPWPAAPKQGRSRLPGNSGCTAGLCACPAGSGATAVNPALFPTYLMQTFRID